MNWKKNMAGLMTVFNTKLNRNYIGNDLSSVWNLNFYNDQLARLNDTLGEKNCFPGNVIN